MPNIRSEPGSTPAVIGLDLDAGTRCAHFHGPNDIIAIKMRCCATYYACSDCHTALADHSAAVWPLQEWNQPAILCGACKAQLTVAEYMNCGDQCPRCSASFNPGCRKHYHLYFEVPAVSR